MDRRPVAGRIAALLGLGLLAAAAVAVAIALGSPPPRDPQAEADALVHGIRAEVTVDGSSRLAARAIADFGVGADVRLVRVRIVEELRVTIRLESAAEIVFAGPLVACLVGPDAAPDDAGLSDRCWGDAAAGSRLEALMPRDAAGRTVLRPGSRTTLVLAARRGMHGCDYPPGTWRLEVRADPLVGGVAAGPRYAPDATFTVPFEPGEVLPLIEERRYCGLASKVVREQGEPAVLPD